MKFPVNLTEFFNSEQYAIPITALKYGQYGPHKSVHTSRSRLCIYHLLPYLGNVLDGVIHIHFNTDHIYVMPVFVSWCYYQ